MQIEPTQFAERLVSGMPDAIVYADAEGVIRLWNRGAVRIFGFAEEEAVGCSLARHNHSGNACVSAIGTDTRRRCARGIRAIGDGQILSVPAMRKDGERISVEFTIVPFTDDSGQMVGIAAVMRDATARFEELRGLRRQLAAALPT